MAEKIQATPPSVSSNDAILEILTSMKRLEKHTSESARKADERMKRLEEHVFRESLPQTKMSSFERHEVRESLSKEDILASQEFIGVHRSLAEEMRSESTGLGAGDSSQSADEDELYRRPSQDARRKARAPALEKSWEDEKVHTVSLKGVQPGARGKFKDGVTAAHKIRESILRHEPAQLDIRPPPEVNFIAPETNTTQVGDANFIKEAEARKLCRLKDPREFSHATTWVKQHDLIRLRDPEAHARGWTRYITQEAVEAILVYNSEEVAVDGVQHPIYLGDGDQYMGRAQVIYCIDASTNAYKNSPLYDVSIAFPSTNPDELMRLDYDVVRVIVLAISAPRTPEHCKEAVMKLVSLELPLKRKKAIKAVTVLDLEDGQRLADLHMNLNRVLRSVILRVDTARAYARELGETVPKQRPMVYKSFGKTSDVKSTIRCVYEDLGAEVAKQLFDQVHDGPTTPAMTEELQKVADAQGYPIGKELEKFKFKTSDVYFQLMTAYWERLSGESKKMLSTLDNHGLERTTLDLGALQFHSTEPTSEEIAAATPENFQQAARYFLEINKHLQAVSGGKRGFKTDKFDGIPICFKTALQMEGERPCDGLVFGGGACPGHTNRDRADWIKALRYLISVCKKDLEYLKRRLDHLEKLCGALEAGGKVPEIPTLPGTVRSASVQVLEREVTPDGDAEDDLASDDEEYSPFRAGM